MIHEQQVRERAYYIWEDEGRVFGRADAHWLQAEAELAATAATVLTVEPVVEASALAPAKALKPAAARAKVKTAKTLTDSAAKSSAKSSAKSPAKAPAKAAKKAEAPTAAVKVRRAPRGVESGAALH